MQQKFDPMTGKPIVEQKFDPMTGQPIPQKKFDPKTGKPLSGTGSVVTPKSPKGIKGIIAAAAIVVIVAIGGVSLAKNGLFLSSSNKVLVATANTFADAPAILADLSEVELAAKDDMTIQMEVDAADGYINGTFVNTSKEKQLSAVIDISDVPEIEVLAGIDKEYVKLQVPSFSDSVMAYNYTKEKTGFLADNLDEEELQMLDDVIASVYESGSDSEKMAEALKDVVSTEYDELEFEKVDKEEFEVNGKDVKCKGYETTLTEDTMLNIIDGIEDVYYEYYGDAFDSLEDMTGESVTELFDEMRDSFEGMPDIDTTFYIYKNMLAAICLDAEGSELEIRFLGGDSRMQNMEVVVDRETVMEIEGEKDGSEETLSFISYDEEMMTVDYDTKSGEFCLDIYGGETVFEGVLTAEKNELTIALDTIEMYGEDIGSVTVSMSKGGSVEKYDGEMIDIGEASESELEDLVYEYEDLLEDLFSSSSSDRYYY